MNPYVYPASRLTTDPYASRWDGLHQLETVSSSPPLLSSTSTPQAELNASASHLGSATHTPSFPSTPLSTPPLRVQAHVDAHRVQFLVYARALLSVVGLDPRMKVQLSRVINDNGHAT